MLLLKYLKIYGSVLTIIKRNGFALFQRLYIHNFRCLENFEFQYQITITQETQEAQEAQESFDLLLRENIFSVFSLKARLFLF